MTPCFYLGVFLLVPLLFSLTPITKYIQVITVLLLGFTLYFKISLSNIKTDYYPPDVECIDNLANIYHFKNGISEYWDTRYINMLTKTDLYLDQAFS
jgi:hypothetical protein